MLKIEPKVNHVLLRVGATIKSIMDRKGITINHIHEKTGIAAITIKRMIEGDSQMMLNKLAAICEIIKVPLCVLLAEPNSTIIMENTTYTT